MRQFKLQQVLISLLLLSLALAGFAKESGPGVSAEAALKKLLDGNKKFVSENMKHPHQDADRRDTVAKGQKPFAIIVSCSDSRIPPEIVFDQGVGDLFIIRTAGEVVDAVCLGSIEYGAEHLGVQLIMVLGHKKCGAVDATVKGGDAPGNIGSIVDMIKPAVEKAKKQKGDLLDNSIKNNVQLVADKIRGSEIIKHLLEKKKVKIVKAYYDLDTGYVKLLP